MTGQSLAPLARKCNLLSQSGARPKIGPFKSLFNRPIDLIRNHLSSISHSGHDWPVKRNMKVESPALCGAGWHPAAGWQRWRPASLRRGPVRRLAPLRHRKGRVPLGRRMPSCPTKGLWPCVPVCSDACRFAVESRWPPLSCRAPEQQSNRVELTIRNIFGLECS